MNRGRYWIDNDAAIGPTIGDIDTKHTPVVRVWKRFGNFVLGNCVAFFVGEQAEQHAHAFIAAMLEWEEVRR